VKVIFHSPIGFKMNKIPDMVPYDILHNRFFKDMNKVLNKWFAERESIQSSYASFFGVMYNPELYLSNRLLMLAGAIESYHTKFLESNSITKILIQHLVNRTLDIVSSISMDHNDKTWLENAIRSRNTLSLTKRIIEVYQRYEDIIPKLSNMDCKSRFAKEVTSYRNRFAHGEIISDKTSDEHLFWTVERLHFLLKLLFLSKLGYSNKEIEQLLIYKPDGHEEVWEYENIIHAFNTIESN
jgi:hypothetical protein